MSNSSSRRTSSRQNRKAPWILAVVGVILFGCTGIVVINTVRTIVDAFTGSGATPAPAEVAAWAPDSAVLTIAVSPVMAPVLSELAADFNEQGRRAPDGKNLKVEVVASDPEEMVRAALASPPSRRSRPTAASGSTGWSSNGPPTPPTPNQSSDSAMPIAQRRIASQQRYAVSPIVLAAWEDVARGLGWPDAPVSWQDVQQRATQDPDFKWSHANTKHASGSAGRAG
jgi:Ca-activated chloride channel family protein